MNVLEAIKNVDVVKEFQDFGVRNKISDDQTICSIVWEFARKLPYSMDYKDKDFVPGIFLNISPEVPTKSIFKEFDSLYHKMISWSDTIRSGILLQICNVFQVMLMKQIPSNYELKEEDFHNLGIDQMSGDNEYNLIVFETLKKLPDYCIKLNSVQSLDERRKMLNDIYMEIFDRVGQKLGGFRKTDIIADNITKVQHHKATIPCSPHKDLEMLYYFAPIRLYSGVDELVAKINRLMGINPNKFNIEA